MPGPTRWSRPFSFTGTAATLRARAADLADQGVTEIVYQPAGPDIRRELQTFIEGAQASDPEDCFQDEGGVGLVEGRGPAREEVECLGGLPAGLGGVGEDGETAVGGQLQHLLREAEVATGNRTWGLNV